MRDVAFFVEDYGHTIVLKSLINRLSHEFAVPVQLREYNNTGGHGRVETEFARFVRNVAHSTAVRPDMIVVATDANCVGFRERLKRMRGAAELLRELVVYAIPDPHLERWLLLDSAAFKAVLGKGCQAPDYKCDRDRYKRLLSEAVRAAGQTPLLGGLEHAEEIVQHMRLDTVANQDDAFGDLLQQLRSFFRRWQENPSE
jgi:hypothetical protein